MQHHRSSSPTNIETIEYPESINHVRQHTANPQHIPTEHQRLILSEGSTSPNFVWPTHEYMMEDESLIDDKLNYSTQFLNTLQRNQDFKSLPQEEDFDVFLTNDDLFETDAVANTRYQNEMEPKAKRQKLQSSSHQQQQQQQLSNEIIAAGAAVNNMNEQQQNDFLKMMLSEQAKQAQEIDQLKRQVNELMMQLIQKQAAEQQQLLMYQQYQQQQYQLYQYQLQQQMLQQQLQSKSNPSDKINSTKKVVKK